MPSDMDWYIPGRVVYVREYGSLSLEEVKASNDTARGLLDQSGRKLHFLIDHTALESAPKSLSGLISILDTFRHENMGWFVIFGHAGNRYFRALAQFITRFFGTNMREVDTREQALMFLIELDPDLGPFIQEKEGPSLPYESQGD